MTVLRDNGWLMLAALAFCMTIGLDQPLLTQQTPLLAIQGRE